MGQSSLNIHIASLHTTAIGGGRGSCMIHETAPGNRKLIMFKYCSTNDLILHDQDTYIKSTETEMLSFWRNFCHCLHWKLPFWQLPAQPVMKILSKRYFRFSECDCAIPYTETEMSLSWRNSRNWLHRKLSSKVVKMISYGAANGEIFVKMTTFPFQRSVYSVYPVDFKCMI